jgi:hypothetical protein
MDIETSLKLPQFALHYATALRGPRSDSIDRELISWDLGLRILHLHLISDPGARIFLTEIPSPKNLDSVKLLSTDEVSGLLRFNRSCRRGTSPWLNDSWSHPQPF